ncbi:Probable serine incorporator, partial [Geodia barretti]
SDLAAGALRGCCKIGCQQIANFGRKCCTISGDATPICCCASMGICLLDLLCCCGGSASCGLRCCGYGRKCKSSILTRFLYLSFLLAIVFVSSILLAPNVQRAMQQQANVLCVNNNQSVVSYVVTFPTANANGSLLNCDQFIGYLAVYRICMGVALFFLVMMFLMLHVLSSKDPRSYVQNGFWGIKWIVVIAITAAIFFIPDGSNLAFSRTAMALGLIGSFMFIIIQVIFLVDLAHCMAEFPLNRAEESENKWWYLPIAVGTAFINFFAFAGIVLMYVYFTELKSCSLNKFFITSTLFFGLIVSIVAVLPCVQKVQPKSGLLQASVVSGYCTYQTWSAISTEPYGPDHDCRVDGNTFAVFVDNGNALAASIVGILVLLLTIAFICFSLSSTSRLRKFRGSKRENKVTPMAPKELTNDFAFSNCGFQRSLLCCDCLPDDKQEEESSVEEDEETHCCRMNGVDDEKNGVTYSYSLFHFLMLISVLYLMMHLTNWAE